MTTDRSPSSTVTLLPHHRLELKAAVTQLEETSFATKLADHAGQPVNAILKYLPKRIHASLRDILHQAIMQSLEVALSTLGSQESVLPTGLTSKVLTGLSGGIGGLFGMVSLPLELPITTTLMIRSIAEIGRQEGEDITSMEGKMACLQVFALGYNGNHEKIDVGYYATRTLLTKLTQDMSAYVIERGAVTLASPMLSRLVGAIAARFGLVVSERIAAGALPLIGAVGGASVNVIFMDYFQRVAHGHFTVRRLERHYGREIIQDLYAQEKQRLSIKDPFKQKNTKAVPK